MEIHCHCRRCGKPFTRTFTLERLKQLMRCLNVAHETGHTDGHANTVEEFVLWHKKTALCQRCIAKLAEAEGYVLELK